MRPPLRGSQRGWSCDPPLRGGGEWGERCPARVGRGRRRAWSIPKMAATGADLAATGTQESGGRRRAIFQKWQPQASSWQPLAPKKLGGGEEQIAKIAATGAELADTGAKESGAKRRAIFQKLQPQAPTWQPQPLRKVGRGEKPYSKSCSHRRQAGCQIGRPQPLVGY